MYSYFTFSRPTFCPLRFFIGGGGGASVIDTEYLLPNSYVHLRAWNPICSLPVNIITF